MTGADEMNRIEIVGLFTALESLCEKEDLESIRKVVKAVLYEAVMAKKEEQEK